MIRSSLPLLGVLFCLFTACWSASTFAAADIQECLGISDPTQRLACFDDSARAAASTSPPAAPALPAARPTPPTPPTPPAAPASVLSPQQAFGLPDKKVAAEEVSAGTRAADIPKIEGHLRTIKLAADRRAVFSLDNDQIWRQLVPDGEELLAKPGDAVTITRGLFGSFWLQLPSGRGCKVSRLH